LSNALLLGSFLLCGSNSWAQSVDYTVATSNIFNAANAPLGGVSGCAITIGDHYYASQQFTVPSNATYTIETTSSEMTFYGGPDTFIAIYKTAFNAASPATGLVACNDDIDGGSYLSLVTTALVTGTTYTIVITSYYDTAHSSVSGNGGTDIITGAVTASFTPNDVILGAATGGAGGSGGSTPVNAPIDLHFSKQVESYSTEIELK